MYNFKQTNEMDKIILKMYSDEGLVNLDIEKVKGSKIKIYCVYKGIRLLEMGPIPLERVGDVIRIEDMKIRIDPHTDVTVKKVCSKCHSETTA